MLDDAVQKRIWINFLSDAPESEIYMKVIGQPHSFLYLGIYDFWLFVYQKQLHGCCIHSKQEISKATIVYFIVIPRN